VNLLRRHLTYANVVATLALFLVLSGGAAYAAGNLGKNSVGTKQLKNSAVTTAKLKNGAVTGAKVAVGSLRTVPSATNASHADNATSASHAENATNAGHADNATSAGQAENASNAANAAALQGMSAAQVAALATLHCPSGTAEAAGLCFETSARAQTSFTEAILTCGAAGRLLPSMTELITYFKVTATASVSEEWVGQPYFEAPNINRAEAISVGPGGLSIGAELLSTPHRFRCAVPPSN
jgi:hypothetical protein